MISRVLGTTVELIDAGGSKSTVSVTALCADPDFEPTPATTRPPAPLPPRELLDGLSPTTLNRALWWEGHLVEVISGVRLSSGPRVAPLAVYNPERQTLRQREVAKVAELAAGGHGVTLKTFQRMRLSYQSKGVAGLVDGRQRRAGPAATDERLLSAIRRATAQETNRSTGTVTRLQRRVIQILQQDGVDPAEVMPSRATFFRLIEQLTKGRHTFGSAPTRRSLAQRPQGLFGSVGVMRPGELVQVDSTALDVRGVLDDGTVDRVELTWMVDVATRTIAAAVLRPTTKTVDASLLLARALTPEPMRPGWVDALRMSRSVLPYRRLLDLDGRIEHAAARPMIVPETIVCDHGMVYLSASFKAACRAMGISFQPTHPGSPWEKGIVERSFGSVATLFAQYVKGYVGRSVDRRGKNAELDAVFSIGELQELLDEWIVACWQNRPHDGLRHPVTPGKSLTPNEQYAALIEVAGYVPVPLSTGDYLELLPMKWRTINSYGIKINHRRYDDAGLNPHRGQHSGIATSKGLWEVHYDPYDVTRVWVRNHPGGWITVPWNHLSSTPVPFGDQAWSQAQQILRRRGENPHTESDIADAVNALLVKAETGPAAAGPDLGQVKRTRRTAARTRATNTAAWPQPNGPAHDQPPSTDAPPANEPVHTVVPLPIFDAHAEAKKWW